jgi:hypothetical protein
MDFLHQPGSRGSGNRNVPASQVKALSRLKDRALQTGLLLFLRPKLKRYGDLRDITVDTSKKVLTLEIDLHGETVPLTVSQARYHLEKDGDRMFLIIRDVKVSKPWIQNLIEDHFDEVRLPAPDSLHGLLNRLL